MKPMTLPKSEETGVPHKVYDQTIEDLDERRDKAVRFETGFQAANYLGISPQTLFKNRIKGKTVFSPTYNKRFAIRVAQ